MRLFVALNLPEAEKDRLYEAASVLRGQDWPVRWVERDTIHLTLKFLGEVKEEMRAQLEDSLSAAVRDSKPFDLKVAGFGAFPNARRARVIWVGVEDKRVLYELQEHVEEAATPLGFRREARAYQPHITLGRVKGEGGGAALPGLEAILKDLHFEGKLPALTVDLMRSHLSPKGARYERIFAAPIGKD